MDIELAMPERQWLGQAKWHWVQLENGKVVPMFWMPDWQEPGDRLGAWVTNSGIIAPASAHRRGWLWLCPCEPPSAAIMGLANQIRDQQLRDLAREQQP